MIKYNLKDINDWNFDGSNVAKVYRNGAVVYYKLSGESPTPSYSYAFKRISRGGSAYTFQCDSTSAQTVTSAQTRSGLTTEQLSSTTATETPVSVTFGDCCKSIGSSACSGWTQLTSVTISDSVTSIGKNAFGRCTGLTSVIIPDSVTSIGNGAFYGCSSLTSIIIPNSVTSLGTGAFRNCSSLTSITVETTTPPTLGSNVFNNTNDCPIYVPSVSLEDYKTAWSSYADRIQAIPSPEPTFKYKFTLNDDSVVSAECDATSAITIAETSAYQSTMVQAEIGDCVTSIGDSAFSGYTNLTSITISNTVTNIGKNAFGRCTGLTSVIIPESVTTISSNAFSNCKNLTSISIPSGVTTIGDYAFYGCFTLNSITVEATTPPLLSGNYAFGVTNNCPIYVPSESVETYKTASYWSTYADRIQAIS